MMDTEERKLILIVDDSPANIMVAHEILRDLYRTRVATSGAVALKAAHGLPSPDLILLDIMMPEMDGYEVCSRLKADLVTREIPVIFLTAMTDPKEETRGFALGAVDYIHKPFSPSVLLARVHTHLRLREAHEQLIQTALGSFGAPGVAASSASPLVARLKSLLEANDGDAVNALQPVAAALAGGVEAELLTSLRDSVHELDYGAALATLGRIVKEINLPSTKTN
jgi:CheY-like chemotaxis protein